MREFWALRVPSPHQTHHDDPRGRHASCSPIRWRRRCSTLKSSTSCREKEKKKVRKTATQTNKHTHTHAPANAGHHGGLNEEDRVRHSLARCDRLQSHSQQQRRCSKKKAHKSVCANLLHADTNNGEVRHGDSHWKSNGKRVEPRGAKYSRSIRKKTNKKKTTVTYEERNGSQQSANVHTTTAPIVIILIALPTLEICQ